MISGSCPYCGESFHLGCPDEMPCWGKHECESCGKTYWEYYSRWRPKTYTEDEFNVEFTVNEETKAITPKENPVIGDEKNTQYAEDILHKRSIGFETTDPISDKDLAILNRWSGQELSERQWILVFVGSALDMEQKLIYGKGPR